MVTLATTAVVGSIGAPRLLSPKAADQAPLALVSGTPKAPAVPGRHLPASGRNSAYASPPPWEGGRTGRSMRYAGDRWCNVCGRNPPAACPRYHHRADEPKGHRVGRASLDASARPAPDKFSDKPRRPPPVPPGSGGCSCPGHTGWKAGGKGSPDTKMAAGVASGGSTHSRACATNASRNIAEGKAVATKTSAPPSCLHKPNSGASCGISAVAAVRA